MQGKDRRELYRRWLGYVGHYRGLMAAALVIVVAAIGVDLAVPRAFAYIIDVMLSKDSLARGRVDLPLLGAVALGPSFLVVGAALAALVLVKGVLLRGRTVLLSRVGENIHLEIRGDLFEKIHHLPMSFFDASYTGRIMARVTTDADALWDLLYSGVSGLVAPLVTFVLVLAVVAAEAPLLSLVLLVVLPAFAVFFIRARRTMVRSVRRQRTALSSLYARLQEQIAGVRTVRVYGQARAESTRFRRVLRLLFMHNMNIMKGFGFLGAASEVTVGVGSVLILCFGGWLAMTGRATLGQVVQFYAYAGLLFAPLVSISNTVARTISQADVALERIFELMDEEPAREFKGGVTCPSLAGGISIQGLSFAYRPGVPVLRDVSLEIEPRWMAAIVGPSGGGKTSLVNLVCRFYDFEKGRILVDGQDITTLEVESFRSQVSYIFQETFLFGGTVFRNIQYARPDASREEVMEAARLADADAFITALPEGYDTVLGERGVNISGGQKQRISIARALLRKPRLLVMDEPTSSLDAESEAVILHAMETVFRGMTRIVIAHRLSTVMHADRIFVLDRGELVQQGTHAALLAQDGLYRDLCQKQLYAGAGPGA